MCIPNTSEATNSATTSAEVDSRIRSQSSPGCNGCKGGGHKAEQAKELGKAEEDFQASQW